jgi:hypothetical protein
MEGVSLHCIYISNLYLCQDIRASKVRECEWGCVLNGEYLDLRDMKLHETGDEHCIIRRVISYYLVDDIWKDDVYGTWGTKGREKQRTDTLVGKFVRNNHLKYVNVGGR